MEQLRIALPRFYEELAEALLQTKHSNLCTELETASFKRYTYDPDIEAMYLYIEAKNKPCESIPIPRLNGLVVIDVNKSGNVFGIEVLDRPDVFAELDDFLLK